ncbi:alpha/beta hydrolase fold [Musa troglodytarum]|uniref:Alpha/beta hydrolase fold n=1 Tax=Musa troglodytarum TaxID=320322 RepID=A0A9E7GM30_9LILI|nr:alpha/beta hydrolase fold [Musa troglodytarum]
MDPYKLLGVSRNPDGSLTRSGLVPLLPPSDPAVLCQDLPLNPARGTTFRLFLPRQPPPAPKLPLILYFHGGGFIIFRAASGPIHAACARLAASLPAIVLSVDYRLAPEHRLPAAYDDALDALLWLRSQAADGRGDLPFHYCADFSRCFLMGTSAGGNIAFYAAVRAAAMTDSLHPVKIAGLVFDQPYFGGVERTESEERVKEDKIIPLVANDLMWELALPEGANRDHEYCNPTANEAKLLAAVGNLPRCLVRGHIGDPLYDRQREFAGMLERRGVSVVARMESEGLHGMEMLDASKEEELVADVRRFLCFEDAGVGLQRL